VNAGTSDLAAAADALRSRLPEQIAALAGIAYNYRWAGTPVGRELFASVDPKRWAACAANPVRLLQEAHPSRLEAVAAVRSTDVADRDLEDVPNVSPLATSQAGWRSGPSGQSRAS